MKKNLVPLNTYPLHSATAKQLAEMGLKKKTFILPINLVKALETKAVQEDSSETELVREALMLRILRGLK